MRTFETTLPGVVVFEPRRFSDSRGFFVETFQADRYALWGAGGPPLFRTTCLALPRGPSGIASSEPQSPRQAHQCLAGNVMDVAVDVRLGSPTFGKSFTAELSEENGLQMYIPRGFAHGFVVLSESADFFYKCDTVYSPEDEITVSWSDPALGIDWQVLDPKVSPKDAAALPLSQIDRLPKYEG